MRTNRFTYVCVCMLLVIDGINQYHLYHYCDVTATTGHWSMENQNALTPTRIQLKHSPVAGRLFQHVVSGWKATQKRCGSTRRGQNVSLESTPWPWVAEYVKHLKLHGKCTIIVVTTIVRFSTEESLETCRSIIFTNRVYSFQYPICKEKAVVSDAFQPTNDM